MHINHEQGFTGFIKNVSMFYEEIATSGWAMSWLQSWYLNSLQKYIN